VKIKLLVSVAGVWKGDGFSYNLGDVVEVETALAQDLVKAGHAETVKPPPKRTQRKKKA